MDSNHSKEKRRSRGTRRKDVGAIIKALTIILAEEENYLDNIPENLAYSIRAEEAADSIAMLSEAIETLSEAY
jgi:hypothetical protein